ncbi:HPr family phosphocarrier protein [Sneathiella sp. CAU 1612]|jgi:phosphocarrier protein HPr|uniref:HPr family phosphocarrier protein n=1 Tax=Sneathiella sedimenti TaxID=2816034 RepID=A0ABS3F2E2_9PROT|nr:HPr family phosphocarrier protein [Sneathiella sedimenti]MBO0332691.1 HPr family phosphocarrier protein [Sneathiella sedimenti]
MKRDLVISNARGLHARAAAKFVKCAEKYNADIHVIKGEYKVSGSSIMGLMMLAASNGTTISVEVTGPDATAAIEALSGLVADKFGEE